MARGRPRTFDREAAVEQAMLIFWAKGFTNTSLSDLTLALKINPPSFYAAFGSKEALYMDVLERYSLEIGEKLWGELLRDGPAYRAVENLLLNTARYLSREKAPKGCLLSLSGMEGGLSENLSNELIHRRHAMFIRLKNCLLAAREKNEISARADCESAARFYFTLQQGMVTRARDGETTDELETTAKSAMRLWPVLLPEGTGAEQG